MTLRHFTDQLRRHQIKKGFSIMQPTRRMSFSSIKKYVVIVSVVAMTAVLLINILIRNNDAENSPSRIPRSTGILKLHAVTSVNKTIKRTNSRLEKACRKTDMGASAYQNWPKANYYAIPNIGLMFCPLKLVKPQFWKELYKMLRKAGRKVGNSKDSNDKMIHFDEENTKRLKLVVMAANPYTWILHGYAEKSLLGIDICRETTLQYFIDKVISGVKLRQNQGLTFTPMIPQCRPCDVNVHSVIHFEDFENDVTSMLHSLKLEQETSQLLASKLDEDVAELTLVAVRHYRSHDCSNISYFRSRLLEAFKLKGYIIPSKLTEYISGLKSLGAHDIRAAVLTLAYGTSLASDDYQKIQRAYYKSVSKETIQYIQSIYNFEFSAFGYDRTP